MAVRKDAYKRRYKMRALGEDGLNIVVSIPRVVLEREAEKHGLTLKEFLAQFKAVAQYDNFEGIIYTFEEVKEKAVVEIRPAQGQNKSNRKRK